MEQITREVGCKFRQFHIDERPWGLVIHRKDADLNHHAAEYIVVGNDVRYEDHQWVEYVRAGFVRGGRQLVQKDLAPEYIIALMRERFQ